jgi:hypothetical protein
MPHVMSAPNVRNKAWHDRWVANVLLGTLNTKVWVKSVLRRSKEAMA